MRPETKATLQRLLQAEKRVAAADRAFVQASLARDRLLRLAALQVSADAYDDKPLAFASLVTGVYERPKHASKVVSE